MLVRCGAVTGCAAKRVVAHQIRQGMRDCGIGPSELGRRMGASRSTVDRLLDMDNPSVTLLTLGRAAAAVGKRLDVALSDARISARQDDRSDGSAQAHPDTTIQRRLLNS